MFVQEAFRAIGCEVICWSQVVDLKLFHPGAEDLKCTMGQPSQEAPLWTSWLLTLQVSSSSRISGGRTVALV